MTGRRAVIGLTVLCALAFSAFSAASASAAGTTAYTCVDGGTGGLGTRFSDPDCENAETGGTYGHVAFASETTTDLQVVQTTNQVLKGTLAGVEVELEATGVTAKEGSYVENTDHGTEPMDVSGEVTLEYTGVTVKKPLLSPACAVEGGKVTTNPLKFTSVTGTTPKTTGIKFEPKEGTTFGNTERHL